MKLVCKDIIFHFNKKHLQDPSIPMWILKAKGETYYVDHVECNAPWSTKETPDNPSTKGSIKIKNCILEIKNGTAKITQADNDREGAHTSSSKGPATISYKALALPEVG